MPASPYREIVLRGPQGWTQELVQLGALRLLYADAAS